MAEVISDINSNLVRVEHGQAYALRGPAATPTPAAWPPVTPGSGGRPSPVPAATVLPDGTTPGGHRFRCRELGSHVRAQQLLRQGHTDLDGNGDGEACDGSP